MTEGMRHPMSASNSLRTLLCPPSPFRADENPIDHDSPAAKEGRFLHAAVPRAFLWNDYSGLDDDQRIVVGRCVDFVHDLIGNETDAQIWFEGVPAAEWKPAETDEYREGTLPVEDAAGNLIIERGVTPDLMVIINFGKTLVIVDWKMGRAEADRPAMYDPQVLVYAVGGRRHLAKLLGREPWEKVESHRVHPRLFGEGQRHSSVAYLPDDWGTKEEYLRGIREASTPDAQAVAGETQCRFCPAKAYCPEFQEWSARANAVIPMTEEELPLMRNEMGNILEFKQEMKQRAKMFEEVEEMARSALAAGEEIVSDSGVRFELKEGNEVRYISDPAMMRGILTGGAGNRESLIDWMMNCTEQLLDQIETGVGNLDPLDNQIRMVSQAMTDVRDHRREEGIIPFDAYLACCKAGVGALETAHKAATGLKGAGAKKAFAILTADAIGKKKNRPSVVVSKKKLK